MKFRARSYSITAVFQIMRMRCHSYFVIIETRQCGLYYAYVEPGATKLSFDKQIVNNPN